MCSAITMMSACSSAAAWRMRLVGTMTGSVGLAGSVGILGSATATFTLVSPPLVPLTITRTGSAEGTVSSFPAGISCGSTCSASFSSGTVVSLTAAPASGSTFGGWSGACSGTGACQVTMSAAKSVGASFTLQSTTSYTLSVTNHGPATATNVIVVDTLPAGALYVTNSASSPACPNGVWPRSCASATASPRSSSSRSDRQMVRAICATSSEWVSRVR